MPRQGEYQPSSSEWVRDQVAEYESSGGTKGTSRGASGGRDHIDGRQLREVAQEPRLRVEHHGVYARSHLRVAHPIERGIGIS